MALQARGSRGKAPELGKDRSSSLSLPLSADTAAERGKHPGEHVSGLLGLLQACARDRPWAGEAGGVACEGTGMSPDVLLALRAVPSGRGLLPSIHSPPEDGLLPSARSV